MEFDVPGETEGVKRRRSVSLSFWQTIRDVNSEEKTPLPLGIFERGKCDKGKEERKKRTVLY